MKNNASNIFYILIGVITIGISGFFYYTTTIYTAKQYNNKLVDKRNLVIESIDELTTCFTSNAKDTDCSAQITELEKTNSEFQTLVEQTKVPKNKGNLKEANLKFIEDVQSVIQNAKAYQNTFDSETTDIVATITNYNQSITEVSNQTQIISEQVTK